MSTAKFNQWVNPDGTENYKCRAWVNFNGTGTVAIRASGNVSSITDNGTGDYRVNFANALQDANYSTAFGAKGMGTAPDYNIKVAIYSLATNIATSLRLVTGRDAVGIADIDLIGVTIFR